MSEHTAGPWTVTTVKTSIGHAHKIEPINACIYVDHRGALETDSKTVTAAANARLLAAAPDMFAALLSCLEHCEKEGGSDVALIVDDNSGHMLDVEMIRAAIKKATTP